MSNILVRALVLEHSSRAILSVILYRGYGFRSTVFKASRVGVWLYSKRTELSGVRVTITLKCKSIPHYGSRGRGQISDAGWHQGLYGGNSYMGSKSGRMVAVVRSRGPTTGRVASAVTLVSVFRATTALMTYILRSSLKHRAVRVVCNELEVRKEKTFWMGAGHLRRLRLSSCSYNSGHYLMYRLGDALSY